MVITGHEWEVILALAGALQAMTIGIIRYLLNLVAVRDGRIEQLTEAAMVQNKLSEQMAALYVAEQQLRATAKRQ